MRKGTVALFLLTIAAAVLSAPGCTTIERQGLQLVAVASTPTGARVAVNGVHQGLTPCNIRLDPAGKGQIVRIESPGYDPVEIRPRRRLSGRVFLSNVIFCTSLSAFVAVGWTVARSEDATWKEARGAWALSMAALLGLTTITDVAFKKGYELRPKELVVDMTKSDGPPRVRVMLIDPDDLRGIRWVRVRTDPEPPPAD